MITSCFIFHSFKEMSNFSQQLSFNAFIYFYCLYSFNTLRSRQNGRHFADDILKYIFLKKMHEFHLRFHLSLFLRFELTIFQHWFRYWLGAGQATSHYLNQWWLVYWHIYASLGFNELRKWVWFTKKYESRVISYIKDKCMTVVWSYSWALEI